MLLCISTDGMECCVLYYGYMPTVKNSRGHIAEVDCENGFVWINAVNVGAREVAQLQERFAIREDDIEICLPPIQRPQVRTRHAYGMCVLVFPVYDRSSKIIHRTEVDIFFGNEFVISTHADVLESLKRFYAQCSKDLSHEVCFAQDSAEFTLKILQSLIAGIHPMLTHISNDIDDIRSSLFAIKTEEVITDILRIRTNVATLRNTLHGHKRVVEGLMSLPMFNTPKLKYQTENLRESCKEHWDIVDIHHSTLESLHDSYSAFVTARTNDIIKVLTMFAVINFPLTLIAALFAMELDGMPFHNTPNGFWIVFGFMFVVAGLMLWFFKRQKYL